MAKRELPKYEVTADPPGMQIAGGGALFGGSSIVPKGTILTTPSDFTPRAHMRPLNAAAEAAFARYRKEVEASWTDMLKKGVNPHDGMPLDEPMNDREIAQRVAAEVKKIGPLVPRVVGAVKQKRPRIEAGTFQAESAAPPKPREEEEPEPDLMPQGARASDS